MFLPSYFDLFNWIYQFIAKQYICQGFFDLFWTGNKKSA
jgi:hypothetical protein